MFTRTVSKSTAVTPREPVLTQRVRLSCKFKLKDSDLFGLKTFYRAHKAGVIIGAVVVVLGLVVTIILEERSSNVRNG